MLLATRCPSCHTVFRVVADQLKLRGGLVRCGHCQEVFNAQAHLCDMPPEMEAQPAPAPPTPAEAAARSADAVADASEASPALGNAMPVDERTDAQSPAEAGTTFLHAVAGKPEGDDAARTDIPAPVAASESPEPHPAEAGDATPARVLLRQQDASAATLDVPAAATLPARPRPPRKYLWRGAAAVLLMAALAQFAWLRHGALIDRWPALYAPTARLCQSIGCTVMPPRRVDALVIESSTLNRETDAAGTPVGENGTQTLILTLFLRNRAPYPVAFPSLELTLSDAQSQPAARRVFDAADYVPRSELHGGLAPHAERAIRLRLMSTVAVAANYQVAARYP